MPRHFAKKVLDWYSANTRSLPWKEDSDPYKTWISEIILQQTRVAQGTPYYLRFIEAFPTIRDLAAAKEDQVLKLWEGLGYYSRARNLHSTAKHICNELNGVFPSTYDELLQLKGVGPYTAAAIASFAYGIAHPVMDGNVLRLVSRYYGINHSIDKSGAKKEIMQVLEEAIKDTNPAHFNQAIMDLGALVCTPRKTLCTECPLSDSCYAFKNDKVSELPIRSKKIKKTTRHLVYYLVQDKDATYIRRRNGKGIWQGLYEMPLTEISAKEFDKPPHLETVKFDHKSNETSPAYKHLLSHQTLHIKFIIGKGTLDDKEFKKVKLKDLERYAFPKVISNFLKERKLVGEEAS